MTMVIEPFFNIFTLRQRVVLKHSFVLLFESDKQLYCLLHPDI